MKETALPEPEYKEEMGGFSVYFNKDIYTVNPNRKIEEDTRTPEELISIIDSHNTEIDNILSILKDKGI